MIFWALMSLIIRLEPPAQVTNQLESCGHLMIIYEPPLIVNTGEEKFSLLLSIASWTTGWLTIFFYSDPRSDEDTLPFLLVPLWYSPFSTFDVTSLSLVVFRLYALTPSLLEWPVQLIINYTLTNDCHVNLPNLPIFPHHIIVLYGT